MPEEDDEIREEIRQLEARRRDLSQHNLSEVTALGQMGVAADPMSLAIIRLDTFIEFIFARIGNVSDDVRKMLSLQFEIKFEESTAETLKEVKAEARKALLGATVSNADLKKMWRQQQANGKEPGPGGLIRP